MIDCWKDLLVSIHNLQFLVKATLELLGANLESIIYDMNKTLRSKPVDSFALLFFIQFDFCIYPDVKCIIQQAFLKIEPKDTIVRFCMKTVLLRFIQNVADLFI